MTKIKKYKFWRLSNMWTKVHWFTWKPVKTHLKQPCLYNPWPRYSGMPQYSGTHILTRLEHQATLSESGHIRACSYARDNLSSLIVVCHYFIYDPLRRACPNDVASMDPLIVACYMGMPKSTRKAGIMGLGVFRVPL